MLCYNVSEREEDSGEFVDEVVYGRLAPLVTLNTMGRYVTTRQLRVSIGVVRPAREEHLSLRARHHTPLHRLTILLFSKCVACCEASLVYLPKVIPNPEPLSSLCPPLQIFQ